MFDCFSALLLAVHQHGTVPVSFFLIISQCTVHSNYPTVYLLFVPAPPLLFCLSKCCSFNISLNFFPSIFNYTSSVSQNRLFFSQLTYHSHRLLFPPTISPLKSKSKIVLTVLLSQEEGNRKSQEPEWLSVLPFCDLKPCLVLKPTHTLSTVNEKIITVNMQLNRHLTFPSSPVLCHYVCAELFCK